MTETRRIATRILVVGLLVAGLLAAVTASAQRAPKRGEARAIKAAAMKHCRKTQETPGSPHKCRWLGGVKVSTVNSRFAYAKVSGPGYDSSGILRRPAKNRKRWRVLRVAGGGIQPCSYWYAVAPEPVVSDLRISGFDEASGNFDYERC